MPTIEKVLAYARKLAHDLTLEMERQESSRGYGFYWAAEPEAEGRISARSTSAVEFFRQYAGYDSVWLKHATDA